MDRYLRVVPTEDVINLLGGNTVTEQHLPNLRFLLMEPELDPEGLVVIFHLHVAEDVPDGPKDPLRQRLLEINARVAATAAPLDEGLESL